MPADRGAAHSSLRRRGGWESSASARAAIGASVPLLASSACRSASRAGQAGRELVGVELGQPQRHDREDEQLGGPEELEGTLPADRLGQQPAAGRSVDHDRREHQQDEGGYPDADKPGERAAQTHDELVPVPTVRDLVQQDRLRRPPIVVP